MTRLKNNRLLFLLITGAVFFIPIGSYANNSPTWSLEKTLGRAESRVNGVGISPDTKFIAYMEKGGQVYIHRVGGDWPLIHVFHETDVHKTGDVEFTNDGQSMVYGFLNNDRDAVLQVVDVDDWEKTTRRTHSSRSGYSAGVPGDLQFSRDDRWLVTGTNSNHCYVWSTEDKYSLEKVFNPSRYSKNPSGIAISPDGEYVLVTASQGTPDVYDVGTWEKVSTLRNISRSSAPVIGENHTMVFSNKSNRVWVYEKNEDWSQVAEFKSEGTVGRSRFSTSNNWLALGDNQGNLDLVRTENWKKQETISNTQSSVTGINFSTDNKYLAYASEDKVFVHSVPSPQQKKIYSGQQLPLKELSGEKISRLILNKNDGESVLTIEYGDDSSLNVAYGNDFSLTIVDEPTEGIEVKLEPPKKN
jgi:WD40 repeat protein